MSEVKDPVKLARAAHIVRMALDRSGLALSDLDAGDGQLCPCPECAAAAAPTETKSHPAE